MSKVLSDVIDTAKLVLWDKSHEGYSKGLDIKG